MASSLDATLSGELERVVAYARGDRGILGVLRQDHVRIAALLHSIGRHLDEPDARAELLERAGDELYAHCVAEGQILYAWRKRTAPRANPIRQAEQEHDEILALLRTLRQMPAEDPSWRECFESLHRLVALHFQDEEDQLFAAVRDELQADDRSTLADRYVRARDALLGRRVDD